MKPVYQAVKFSQALASSAAVLALGLVIYLIFTPDISFLGDLGWASICLGVLSGVFGYLLIFVFTKTYLIRSSAMHELMQTLSSMFRNFSWPAIFVISAMAGISEELLLRGLVQHYLVSYTNPAFGIIVASLIFGLMHFLSRVYVLVTFALGLAFGIAYHLTNSLALVMVAHAAYDVLAFAVLVKYPRSLNLR